MLIAYRLRQRVNGLTLDVALLDNQISEMCYTIFIDRVTSLVIGLNEQLILLGAPLPAHFLFTERQHT